jgi:hypothetical protein
MHCTLCISSTIKPEDKLSTTGYGFIGEGEERVMAPVPSEQKLATHEGLEHHKYNLRISKQKKSGTSQAAAEGDATIYLTITPEDELYARTIRTVHLIAVRQLSLNDMYHLLELQNANGAIIVQRWE